MADFFSLPVYNSLRVFYKDLCLHTNKMPRPDRYELVMPLCKEIEKMMTLVAKANDADDKHEFLKNGIDTIDEVKIHIRNLYELSFIRVKGFSVLCDHAESIIVGKEEDWEGLPANKSMRNSPAGIGLIIGDLMSQMLSNIYLNELDQFIKRELKIKHYGRYVDDAFIFHEDKEYLKTVLPTIENFLETKLKLKLNKKKVRITDIGYDVKFLGACIKPHRRYVKNRTINSFKTKLYQISKKIDNKRLTIEEKQEIRSILNSYCGYFSHHRTYKIKRKCFSKANIGKYFTFAKDYNKVKIKK